MPGRAPPEGWFFARGYFLAVELPLIFQPTN
jgi:hypothetical protein